MRRFAVLALALAMAACSDAPASEDLSDYEGEEFAGETYEEYDSRRDSYEGSHGSFEDYDCTEDCGGHEAGYAWAEENGIDEPDNCGGNSWSFEEGCRAYAEENSYF